MGLGLGISSAACCCCCSSYCRPVLASMRNAAHLIRETFRLGIRVRVRVSVRVRVKTLRRSRRHGRTVMSGGRLLARRVARLLTLRACSTYRCPAGAPISSSYA